MDASKRAGRRKLLIEDKGHPLPLPTLNTAHQFTTRSYSLGPIDPAQGQGVDGGDPGKGADTGDVRRTGVGRASAPRQLPLTAHYLRTAIQRRRAKATHSARKLRPSPLFTCTSDDAAEGDISGVRPPTIKPLYSSLRDTSPAAQMMRLLVHFFRSGP